MSATTTSPTGEQSSAACADASSARLGKPQGDSLSSGLTWLFGTVAVVAAAGWIYERRRNAALEHARDTAMSLFGQNSQFKP